MVSFQRSQDCQNKPGEADINSKTSTEHRPSSAPGRRSVRIARFLLVVLVLGVATDTAIRIWRLVASPSPRVILPRTTSTASWQFVDDFPQDLRDQLHFILTDSTLPGEAVITQSNDVARNFLPHAENSEFEDVMQASTLIDATSVAITGRLAKFDDTGKLIAFGVHTRLSFSELTTLVNRNCIAVSSEEAQNCVTFTSKNKTRWKCWSIVGDSGDSFLICETVEQDSGARESESTAR